MEGCWRSPPCTYTHIQPPHRLLAGNLSFVPRLLPAYLPLPLPLAITITITLPAYLALPLPLAITITITITLPAYLALTLVDEVVHYRGGADGLACAGRSLDKGERALYHGAHSVHLKEGR
jgi:hypothetical protein